MPCGSLRLPRDLYTILRSFSRPLLRSPSSVSLSPSIASAPFLPLQWRPHTDAAAPPPRPSTQSPTMGNGGGTKGGTKGGGSSSAPSSSMSPAELAKFAAIADTWWDFEGPFKPLHSMNPIRMSFIRSALCRHFRRDLYSAKPLEGLKIVDVGCGGGILSEPLSRLGANVTGIDAVEKNINIARIHSLSDPLTSSIEYYCTTAEDLVISNKQYDAVIALEVIEHVADPLEFCRSLAALTIPGGAIVISTINRSIRAYATAIVAAEYLLNWLPKGTHQWSRFLTPEELVLILQRASISVHELAGFVYNPVTGDWSLSDDTSMNFIAFGTKKTESDLADLGKEAEKQADPVA